MPAAPVSQREQRPRSAPGAGCGVVDAVAPLPRRASPERGRKRVPSRRGLGAAGGSEAGGPARTLTCSLSPAAGTVSVGTSSCLSLPQHPSPTSAFRHHYIPYFRGKARRAAGSGRRRVAAVSVSHVCVAAWLPRARVSRPAPRSVSVSPALCPSVCECPWEGLLVPREAKERVARSGVGSSRRDQDPSVTCPWARVISFPVSQRRGAKGLLAAAIGTQSRGPERAGTGPQGGLGRTHALRGSHSRVFLGCRPAHCPHLCTDVNPTRNVAELLFSHVPWTWLCPQIYMWKPQCDDVQKRRPRRLLGSRAVIKLGPCSQRTVALWVGDSLSHSARARGKGRVRAGWLV